MIRLPTPRRPAPALTKTLALTLALILPGVPAVAAGDLGVLPQGPYRCWTAGSASGPAVVPDPARSFTVVRGSSYTSDAGGGTYLLAGDRLTFTRGPFQNMRLQRDRAGFWQEISASGEPGRIKCSPGGGSVFPPPDRGGGNDPARASDLRR